MTVSSPLKARLTADMKEAMRAKNAEQLSVIRQILAAIKQKEIDSRTNAAENRPELTEAEVLAVIEKRIKQGRDSISQFQAGGRADLAAKEQAEIDILQTYLPAALTSTELTALIQRAITECNATSIKDMGKVMNMIKPQVQGRADMALVSQEIKTLLAP